ncbi:Ribosomal RNA large subunit methyltransferase K [Phycisphaerales bacterium]|nr:Ribosomal RNA large subunit methyltransferase K [Phycisphaerales bacterium]
MLRDALPKALERRRALLGRGTTQAFRVFSGPADGIDGVFIDVYGPGAVLIVYDDKAPRALEPGLEAAAALRILQPLGVRAVYLKPFSKDRSSLGGVLPPTATDPLPLAGEPLPKSILIREHDWLLEVRLYDGLSTGLFLDQRENRAFVADWIAALAAKRRARNAPAPAVLNTFAYTCAFSVAAAKAGAITTSVDVSARYLEWGERNFSHNSLDPAPHRFARMDTFDFLGYARKKALTYDLIILDPPSFATGSKKKGIRPWSSIADYARLVAESARLLNPQGVILACTNTQELCRPGRLEREISKGVGRPPKWITLPPPPTDFAHERGRFAARAFTA